MHFSDQEKFFMKTAMQLAQESYDLGEVPVGAIVVKNNKNYRKRKEYGNL